MNLVIDEDSRQVRQFVCHCCNTEADRTWANIYDGDTALAVYYASCYHHNGVHEAWIDAILGSWGDNQFDDHITFGCRVGPVTDSPTPAATLVDGGAATPASPIFGQKLTRVQGLAHPGSPNSGSSSTPSSNTTEWSAGMSTGPTRRTTVNTRPDTTPGRSRMPCR